MINKQAWTIYEIHSLHWDSTQSLTSWSADRLLSEKSVSRCKYSLRNQTINSSLNVFLFIFSFFFFFNHFFSYVINLIFIQYDEYLYFSPDYFYFRFQAAFQSSFIFNHHVSFIRILYLRCNFISFHSGLLSFLNKNLKQANQKKRKSFTRNIFLRWDPEILTHLIILFWSSLIDFLTSSNGFDSNVM